MQRTAATSSFFWKESCVLCSVGVTRSQVLVCDWLHSVGQNHFYVMMLIIKGCCFIQSLHFSFELQEDFVQDSKQYSSVPLHLSRRCGFLFGRCGFLSRRSSIKASSV
jgi:hypothetical protein